MKKIYYTNLFLCVIVLTQSVQAGGRLFPESWYYQDPRKNKTDTEKRVYDERRYFEIEMKHAQKATPGSQDFLKAKNLFSDFNAKDPDGCAQVMKQFPDLWKTFLRYKAPPPRTDATKPPVKSWWHKAKNVFSKPPVGDRDIPKEWRQVQNSSSQNKPGIIDRMKGWISPSSQRKPILQNHDGDQLSQDRRNLFHNSLNDTKNKKQLNLDGGHQTNSSDELPKKIALEAQKHVEQKNTLAKEAQESAKNKS
jgi:hypothetical protein